MDLWIRSQDRRKLVKNPQLYCEGFNEEYFIEDVNNKYLKLGTYKTEERALEVLDEIQNLLKTEEMLHIMKSSLNNLDEISEPKYILRPTYQPRVYEMPKE